MWPLSKKCGHLITTTVQAIDPSCHCCKETTREDTKECGWSQTINGFIAFNEGYIPEFSLSRASKYTRGAHWSTYFSSYIGLLQVRWTLCLTYQWVSQRTLCHLVLTSVNREVKCDCLWIKDINTGEKGLLYVLWKTRVLRLRLVSLLILTSRFITNLEDRTVMLMC